MVYILTLWAIFAVLALAIPKKYYKLYFFIMVCLLSWLAFYTVAQPAMDLYRYGNTMDLYRSVGWHWVAQNELSTNPLAAVYLYLISLLGDNRFLPAITVFLVYSFSFGVLYKAAVRFESKEFEIQIAVLFFMLNFNYFYVIDVLRIYLCYAIMAYFLYMDLVEKKHRPLCAVVYVAVCFIHYAVLLFVFIRLLIVLVRHMKGAVANSMLILFPGFIFVAYRVFAMVPWLTGIFELAGERAQAYMVGYNVFGVWQFANSFIRLLLFLLLGMLVFWLAKVASRRAAEQKNLPEQRDCSRISDFTYFGLFVVMATFGLVTNYQMMLRTPNFLQIIYLPILLFTLSKLRRYNKAYKRALTFLIVFESLGNFLYLLVYVYRSAKFF